MLDRARDLPGKKTTLRSLPWQRRLLQSVSRDPNVGGMISLRVFAPTFRHRMSGHFASTWIILVLSSLAPSEARELKTAREVRSLSAKAAEKGEPVAIEGQVIFSDPPNTVFLQDETAGTFFRLQGKQPPAPGDILSVRGVTFPGLYLPGIEEATFEQISSENLPPGIPATYEDLQDGRYHYQRVRVQGIVRSVRAEEEGVSLVVLSMGSSLLRIRVEAPENPEVALVDSQVAISGLAAGLINDRRQLVSPYLRVRNWEEFEFVETAPPLEQIEPVSTTELLTFDSETRGGHRVRIAGQVLGIFQKREMYLRDEDSSLYVALEEPAPSLVSGQFVEVVGFPEMAEFRPRLSNAEIVAESEMAQPPQPQLVSLEELYDGTWDGNLVATEGIVSEAFATDRGIRLTLREGNRNLRVITPDPKESIDRGMRIQVVGICRVEQTRSEQYRAAPELVSIRLRSPEDLAILRKAPWWTPRRLTMTLIAMLLFSGLAILWITILRRQVSRQTLALRSKIEKEAVLEERQRIAREFHDTLEQDLAGLTLRLDAATTQTEDEKLSGFLQGSRHLVTRIQTETRNLVSDLRDARGDNTELNETIESLLEEQPKGIGPRIQLDLDTLPPLPPRTAHHLKMMTREAVTNALKHADASHILIQTRQATDHFEILVRDDGRGFDAGELDRRNPGHFGCMGIRERARKLNAEVSWNTAPGEGTSMLVRIPYP